MIEESGEKLSVNGKTIEELAESFDTPLYIYDQEKIREKISRIQEEFSDHTENFDLHYAVKANNNPKILETVHESGAGFDCASKWEIKLALESGADPEDIIYTCPYNRSDELEYAVEKGVTVNFDSIGIMERLDEMPEKICFRVNPEIEAEGEFGLKFAGKESKFGVAEEKIVEAYRKANDRGAETFGIHMMTGSNVKDPEYFGKLVEKIFDIAEKISKEIGVEFEFVDIGGGLGIAYREDEETLDLEEAAKLAGRKFEEIREEKDVGNPDLVMEPGRFIVGDSGILATQVTEVKESGKKFVGVDTGMHHLIRPMLYDAYHRVQLAGDLGRKKKENVDVVGPVCESTDVLAEDRPMPDVEVGDILAVRDVGAYGFTMASNWNTRPLPAEVLVSAEDVELIRRRQSFCDVFGNTEM